MIPLTLDSILEGILDDEREWAPEENNSVDDDENGMESPLSSHSSTLSSLSPTAHTEVALPSLISQSHANENLVSVNPRLLTTNFGTTSLDAPTSCLNLNLSVVGDSFSTTPLVSKQISGSTLCLTSPLFVSTSSATNSPSYSSSSADSMSPLGDLKPDIASPTTYNLTLDSKTGLLSNKNIRTIEKLQLPTISSEELRNLNSISRNPIKDISTHFLKKSGNCESSANLSSTSLSLSPSEFGNSSLSSTDNRDMTTDNISGIPCISIKTELPDSCSMGIMVRSLFKINFQKM